jgi:hypothetical protein
MENVALQKIDAAQAALVMRAAGLVDPARVHTPESISKCGEAFRLTTAGGSGVFVVEKRGTQLWIHGAGAVASRELTAIGFEVVAAMARHMACDSVAFQTARPGLVRLAKNSGYRVTGFIMEKSI